MLGDFIVSQEIGSKTSARARRHDVGMHIRISSAKPGAALPLKIARPESLYSSSAMQFVSHVHLCTSKPLISFKYRPSFNIFTQSKE